MDNKWGRNIDRTMTDGHTGGIYTEMGLRGGMRQGWMLKLSFYPIAFSSSMTFPFRDRKLLRTIHLIYFELVGSFLYSLPEKVESKLVFVEFNQHSLLQSHLQVIWFPLN